MNFNYFTSQNFFLGKLKIFCILTKLNGINNIRM